jgi:hypothetical protein
MTDKQSDKQPNGWRVAVEAWCWMDLLGSIVRLLAHH